MTQFRDQILAQLSPDCTLGRELVCLPTVDSTNSECKRLAASGAPHGTVVIADSQTGGSGRSGRSFLSPEGGLYLSALLRPSVLPLQAVNLTAWVAVAVCEAVESLCPLWPRIKWPNDIIITRKKLCGILTEMELRPDGALDSVVVGVGLNLHDDFSRLDASLSKKAISLDGLLLKPPSRAQLAAALITSLDALSRDFPQAHDRYLAAYRRRCITLEKQVRVFYPGAQSRIGYATDIDDDFRLLVDFGSGPRPVSSGEVSIRDRRGYV